ncbi:cytochrome o ubiquinol oxidase subunit III [Planctomycetes bacterium CA13]|uniref:Cytochrome o ubiquinol oxidase subunit III n=1 Tax=Novipirellula herctigrandis TaxID=2527986 RepID=A0A5C5ZAK9_9BACT|nr:cytochrome o ubiquinol oxidase subunit III [Planctomycetes bacterium CA13]
MPVSASSLPIDRRYQQGGVLLLASLMMFFLSSILLYALYAYWRRDDPMSMVPLPSAFLVSTLILMLISGLLHLSTLAMRREKRFQTVTLLFASIVLAIVFTAVQLVTMNAMLEGPALVEGNGKGLVGMVAVLVILHALHVAGGVAALGIVLVRTIQHKYDHESYWPIRFAAQYWHFLDIVWLCMLAAFWFTTGGFA